MKYLVLLCTCLFCTYVFAQSETQRGCVKTRGRMINGKHVPGVGLPGAVVSIKDRNAIAVKNEDGTFSFPTNGQQFVVQSVTKKDYALVDADAAPKTYLHSSNVHYFVMETPEQLTQDKLDKERKIRRTLIRQLQDKEDEIETLKAENKISQQKYQELLQGLYRSQDSKQKLISEMAERYAQLDYDQLDEFYRQVSNYIEEGELVKADSLLKTRGDLNTQIEKHLEQGALIQQKKKALNQAESVHQFDKEELAHRCYSYFETFKMQHQHDSAAHYIERRAMLDTTNVKWQNQAAKYLNEYKAQYKLSFKYYLRGLQHSIIKYGEQSEWTCVFYNNLASLYSVSGNYSQSLKLYLKALDIQLKIFGSGHPVVANSYNNIGAVYYSLGDYTKSLEFYQKALEIQERILGTEHPKTATSYSNIGCLYTQIGNYEKALEYFHHDLQIQEKEFGQEHPNTVISYINIGGAYNQQENYPMALEYFQKGLEIQKKILGDKHPNLATILNNIGGIYAYQNKYSESLEYFTKALTIVMNVFGAEHLKTSSSYNNIGYIYSSQGDYQKAIEYYQKAATITEKVLGKEHLDLAIMYGNISEVYNKKGDHTMALAYIEKAISIREKHLGKEHLDVAILYEAKSKIYISQNNYSEAREYKQRILDIYEKKYGTTSMHTYRAKFDVMWLMSKDLMLMEDYVFVANTDDGDTPARQEGLSGEYIMLELSDWNIKDTISLLDINLSLRDKSKSIVVMKDEIISQYHFENKIGVQYSLKFIGKKEKKKIIKAYEKWKKKRQ